MNYQKGDRVRHPTKADWGLGEVLEDGRGDTLRVFFVEAGEKLLSLRYVQPEKVPPELAIDPVLDKLQITSGSSIKYRSLADSTEYFLELFPEGFHDSAYLKEERNYKVRAHELGIDLLGEEIFQSLIADAAYSEVCKRCLRVLNATNLVFPNEKMALKDGLTSLDSQETFAKALNLLLYSTVDVKLRLERLIKVLDEVGAAKWTTVTYFPFIIDPSKYMFVKPTITQHAAELCRFPINYHSQPNWLTYKSVLDFAEHLGDHLGKLKPRDMIDIQSFMWCIAPRTQ